MAGSALSRVAILVVAACVVAGCGSGGSNKSQGSKTHHDLSGGGKSSRGASASTRARLSEAQRRKALLRLSDLAPGFSPDKPSPPTQLMGHPSAACRKVFNGTLNTKPNADGESERDFNDDASNRQAATAVQVVSARHGHAFMTDLAATAKLCGHVQVNQGGITVSAVFQRESMPRLLDESVALRLQMTAEGVTVYTHDIVFRYGDNIGLFGYTTSTSDAGIDIPLGYARKAAKRLRTVVDSA